MAKATKIGLNPDRWVTDRPTRPVSGKKVRLTVDLLPDLHKKLKVKATMEEKTMQELVQQWIAEKVE
jgi:predicted HicB family RNase H-like nuclease